jgi:hypothetical protein
MVFENRVLRRIFVPKRNEMTGGWRELQDEELLNLNSKPSIIRMVRSRKMRLAGYVARMGRRGKHIFMGKPEGKRQLERPRYEWINIKMDLGEI